MVTGFGNFRRRRVRFWFLLLHCSDIPENEVTVEKTSKENNNFFMSFVAAILLKLEY
jgi:hypothetical protein